MTVFAVRANRASMVVTRQARLVCLARCDLSELPDVSFGVVVQVRLPRAVAAFAALGCRG